MFYRRIDLAEFFPCSNAKTLQMIEIVDGEESVTEEISLTNEEFWALENDEFDEDDLPTEIADRFAETYFENLGA